MPDTKISISKIVAISIIASGWLNFAFGQPHYQIIEVKNGGTIQGTVRLKTPVTSEPVSVTKDQQHCGTTKSQVSVRIGKDNGLANAVVYLKGIQKGKKPDTTAAVTLDQKSCEFTPKIVLIPSGGQVDILNSDPILHNVHTYNMNGKSDPKAPGPPTLFNIAFPIQGLKITKTMVEPGRFLALCDAGHPWMNAYLVVMEHPYYAVTDADGLFHLSDIPAGTYELHVWHPGAATVQNNSNAPFLKPAALEQSTQVSVEASRIATINFELVLP